MSDSDFILLFPINDNTEAIYAGWLVDAESFIELIPNPRDATYE
jgi:hypothetical protein